MEILHDLDVPKITLTSYKDISSTVDIDNRMANLDALEQHNLTLKTNLKTQETVVTLSDKPPIHQGVRRRSKVHESPILINSDEIMKTLSKENFLISPKLTRRFSQTNLSNNVKTFEVQIDGGDDNDVDSKQQQRRHSYAGLLERRRKVQAQKCDSTVEEMTKRHNTVGVNNAGLLERRRKVQTQKLESSPEDITKRRNSGGANKPGRRNSRMEIPEERRRCSLEESKEESIAYARIKRKQIDITKSSTYKEIYAHNLRLYSNVFAKQMANTNQIGRELDNLRRSRLKEKALCIPRSRSFNIGVQNKNAENEVIKNLPRSKSEGAKTLRESIRKVVSNLSIIKRDIPITIDHNNNEYENKNTDHSPITSAVNSSNDLQRKTIDQRTQDRVPNDRNLNELDEHSCDSNESDYCVDNDIFNNAEIFNNDNNEDDDADGDDVLVMVINEQKPIDTTRRFSRDRFKEHSTNQRVEFIRKRIKSFDNTVEKMNALISKARSVNRKT